jgi:L-galactose dehydrogenase
MPWFVIYPLGRGWSWGGPDDRFKGNAWVIRNLADIVAKGGNFIVGIGPSPDGRFNQTALDELKEVGTWLAVNGEAIYGTRPRPGELWKEGGELIGPGSKSDNAPSRDYSGGNPPIRFTQTKVGHIIYVLCLGWPGTSLPLKTVPASQVRRVSMLGFRQPLISRSDQVNGTVIDLPARLQSEVNRPCKTAWAFRIDMNNTQPWAAQQPEIRWHQATGKGGAPIMQYSSLGKTGLQVSRLSFGASSLGGVFHPVDETEAIAAVHTALDCGINYFDVAPAYGGTRSETVLGKALRGIARDRYILSTKVGKYTDPNSYGDDTLDYSRTRIRASLDESGARLGTAYFDIIHIHDIEYQNRQHTEWALTEGYDAVQELKREGRIGAVSFGIYPMDLWKRIFSSLDIDAALVHNHYCLNDTQLLDILPVGRDKRIGIINGSPFASGLLTDRGPADWHPASLHDRGLFRKAAEYCQSQGASISRLALQFSSQNPEIPTTLFSTANPQTVLNNVADYEQPCDFALLAEVNKILLPLLNKEWSY